MDNGENTGGRAGSREAQPINYYTLQAWQVLEHLLTVDGETYPREIERALQGVIASGSIAAILKRLDRLGIVEGRHEEPGSSPSGMRPRHLYRLTPSGRRVAEAYVEAHRYRSRAVAARAAVSNPNIGALLEQIQRTHDVTPKMLAVWLEVTEALVVAIGPNADPRALFALLEAAGLRIRIGVEFDRDALLLATTGQAGRPGPPALQPNPSYRTDAFAEYQLSFCPTGSWDRSAGAACAPATGGSRGSINARSRWHACERSRQENRSPGVTCDAHLPRILEFPTHNHRQRQRSTHPRRPLLTGCAFPPRTAGRRPPCFARSGVRGKRADVTQ
jgi:DNA-binding PadR family transcriptional regulator